MRIPGDDWKPLEPANPAFVARVRAEVSEARKRALLVLHPHSNRLGTGRLPEELLAELAERRRAGASWVELARPIWRQVGYPSLESCASAIRGRLLVRGLYRPDAVLSEGQRRASAKRRLPPLTVAAREARALYESGMSLLEVADANWERWGYSSSQSCWWAVRKQWVRRDLPVRTRSEAIALAIRRGRAVVPSV